MFVSTFDTNIFSRGNKNPEVFKYLEQASRNSHLVRSFVWKLSFTQGVAICFKIFCITEEFLVHMIHFTHFQSGNSLFRIVRIESHRLPEWWSKRGVTTISKYIWWRLWLCEIFILSDQKGLGLHCARPRGVLFQNFFFFKKYLRVWNPFPLPAPRRSQLLAGVLPSWY